MASVPVAYVRPEAVDDRVGLLHMVKVSFQYDSATFAVAATFPLTGIFTLHSSYHLRSHTLTDCYLTRTIAHELHQMSQPRFLKQAVHFD